MPSIADIITNAARQYGRDPATLARIGQLESGLNPNAYNAGSGASGLFQFLPKTAAAYDLLNPQDPVANAKAAGHLLADNRMALTRVLGRDPTGGELYLAHQQGAGGAGKLLANPDAPAAAIVGTRAVLSNGGTQGMTARQFADLWTSRFDHTTPGRGTQLGQLYASGALPPMGGAQTLPGLPSAEINPAAVMAANLPTDEFGAPAVPQRAATVANGGAAAEAKRKALITGQGRLGALFA